MTIDDVLSLDGLESMKLRAGQHQTHCMVRWYYIAENEGIADWVVGQELVFVTGINHPRDEANLVQLLIEGHRRNIAGMVILTGESFIHTIPMAVIELANRLGIPLIEQPYSLKMIIVTHVIATALIQHTITLRSQRDLLVQLLTDAYPSLSIAVRRARGLGLELNKSCRVVALRLFRVSTLFTENSVSVAEERLQKVNSLISSTLEEALISHGCNTPLLVLGDLFVLLLPDNKNVAGDGKSWLIRMQKAINHHIAPLLIFSGLSTVVREAHQLSQGLIEARRALDIAEAMQPECGIGDYSEQGVLKLLSAVSDTGLVVEFMQDVLSHLHEPHRRHPYQLMETLDAVLQENGNLLRAAERLHIHRNTLHQRMQRIEQQTKQSLNDPQFRLNASVALLIWRMSNAQHRQELS